jgi:1-acyl-sn-glycerol-3-phosphate acyltransferase
MSTRGSVSGFVGAIPGATYSVAQMVRVGTADIVKAVDPRRLLNREEPTGPLDLRDPEYIRGALPGLKALSDVYFRGEVRGLENIPAEGSVLLVGNHSGGTLIADTFVFAQAFYEHFGPDRLFHQLAHDLVFMVPGIRGLLQPFGTVPASPDNMREALDRGAALLVYPGGDHESYRPSWRSAEIDFAGRKGFVRLALELGVPIVPVVAIGGQETALFLGQGHRVAQALRLDKRLRLKVAPVQIGPPFGVTFLDAPLRLPIPAKITVEVLPLVDLAKELGPDADPEKGYDFVTGLMQDKLDELAEERTLPVIG